eukprot:1889104-Rhodomonas_salina.1
MAVSMHGDILSVHGGYVDVHVGSADIYNGSADIYNGGAALSNLGSKYMDDGDLAAALKVLDKAFELAPDVPGELHYRPMPCPVLTLRCLVLVVWYRGGLLAGSTPPIALRRR